MPPKDYIVYIDPAGETRAVLDIYSYQSDDLMAEGNQIIGYVSSAREADAIAYADQVFRS
jgi:hypothetical protein